MSGGRRALAADAADRPAVPPPAASASPSAGRAGARAGRVACAARIRPSKAASAAECETLEQLPNIGPVLAQELRSIGIRHPRDLAARDGHALYRALCAASGRRQDPCVLDTFLAATDFMRGAAPAPWWAYTARRKREFGDV